MAKKRPPEAPQPEPALRMSAAEAATKLDERIAKAREYLSRAREIRSAAEIDELKNEYYKWDAYNTELLSRMFTTPKLSEEYSFWGFAVGGGREQSLAERLVELTNDISGKVRRLESIKERLELFPIADGVTVAPTTVARPRTNRAFIVHGHNEAARETVARFLERLGVEPIILHEQATEGRTIVEKLEHYSQVDFAVVLLTPDDIGSGQRDGKMNPRARQNVILELGFFVGKLGRKHVCALYQGPLELPSDYLGVGYVELDSRGGWQLQLAREFRAAGFAIDMNQI